MHTFQRQRSHRTRAVLGLGLALLVIATMTGHGCGGPAGGADRDSRGATGTHTHRATPTANGAQPTMGAPQARGGGRLAGLAEDRTIAATFRVRGAADDDDNHQTAHARAAEAIVLDALVNHGLSVFDRDRLDELRRDDMVEAWLVNADAESIQQIAQRYETDLLVVGTALEVETLPAVGDYWQAVAQLQLQVGEQDSGRVALSAMGPPMGVPGHPSHVGVSESAATDAALRAAVGGALGQMGVRVPRPADAVPDVRLTRHHHFGTTAEVSALTFGPDTLVVGTARGELVFYGLHDGTVRPVRDAHQSAVEGAAYAGDGMVATLGSSQIALWDSRTGELIRRIGLGRGATGPLRVDRESQMALFVADRRGVGLCDLRTGEVWHGSRAPHRLDVFSLAFGPMGEPISASRDAIVRHRGDLGSSQVIYDPDTGQSWTASEVLATDMSPDGRVQAVALRHTVIDLQRNQRTDEVLIELVNLEQGRAFNTIDVPRERRRASRDIRAIAFGPNWQYMVSAGRDRTLRLWDVDRAQQLQSMNLDREVNQVSFSLDGRWVAGATERHVIIMRVE